MRTSYPNGFLAEKAVQWLNDPDSCKELWQIVLCYLTLCTAEVLTFPSTQVKIVNFL